ncbi:MAG: phenylalanine--tRNA ligase subunit alpha [Bdellovibrionales bacterium]
MKEKAQSIFKQAKENFLSAKDRKTLYDKKVFYLGKKGEFALLMKDLKNVSAEERPQWGQFLNQLRSELEEIYLKKQEELSEAELSEKIQKEKLDLSLPGPPLSRGTLHPCSLMIQKILEIFKPLGYSTQTGPFIESDWYNFEALNIPPFHPSRDLQDTFYLDDERVLRTHTSPVQIRVLEKSKPPLAILAPGSVFRCDSDISHSPMFHQVEGLFVDTKVSFADLKGTLSYFLKELFGSGVEVRFRPSYFPFTEPSAEYDVSCPFCKKKGCSICKKSGWIEIGGCGLVHPKVFEKTTQGSWQGFAFGLGVERIAIILYGIPDIRLFFENDMRFLKQFEGL